MTPDQRLFLCVDHLDECRRAIQKRTAGARNHLLVAAGFVKMDLDEPTSGPLLRNLLKAAGWLVSCPDAAAGYVTGVHQELSSLLNRKKADAAREERAKAESEATEAAAFEVQGVLDRMRRDSERAAKAVPGMPWRKARASVVLGFLPDPPHLAVVDLVASECADDPEVAKRLDEFRNCLSPAQQADFDACRKECRDARDRAGAEAPNDLFLARRKPGEAGR